MNNGLGYRLFKTYIRFFHNTVYYRKQYCLDAGNIPENGPLMIVSDHQNSLNDALAMLLAVPPRNGRKIRIVSRADVFRPGVKRALRWLGILPAFRLAYEGAESLSANLETFTEAERELLSDGTLIIYPEAGHQDRHWLGTFSLGYLRLLFGAAEKTGFRKDFFILPSCNHYSDYFNIREDVLIRFGTPISIAPYYELYKTKPRTAQRQVNEAVRKQISAMMLDITDAENYDAIDFLRRNTFGIHYAGALGCDPQKLPEKLAADKQLFAALEALKATQKEVLLNLYNKVKTLSALLQRKRIPEQALERRPSLGTLFSDGLLLLAGLPAFLFACIPNILVYAIPNLINARIKDRMFHASFRIGLSLLVTIPVFYPLTALLTWALTRSWPLALLHLACLPFLAVFAWKYAGKLKQWRQDIRLMKLYRKGELNEITDLRTHIHASLSRLLKHTHN
jgi:1-acyl-sn-glycerol-3-phosphate acyltransferase